MEEEAQQKEIGGKRIKIHIIGKKAVNAGEDLPNPAYIKQNTHPLKNYKVGQ